MAERSTWPETHLNAVNKLLCWDCSFLGKATRSAATSPHPNLLCSPSSCPLGKTSVVVVEVEVAVVVVVVGAVSDTAVEKKKHFPATLSLSFSSLSASPEVTHESVQFENS